MSSPLPFTLPSAPRVIAGFVVLVGAVALLGAAVREPIAAFAAAIVGRLGIVGLFAAVLATDQVPGIGFQPALFFGYTGGIPVLPLLAATFAGSLAASVLMYAIGRALRGSERVVGTLDRWRVGGWLRDHGARAIAVAAVAPVPYGVATLGAGAVGVGLRDLLVGASFRAVKMALTLAAIVAGWGA